MEDYKEQIAYAMGGEAPSEETPEQPKETETPSEPEKDKEPKEETPAEKPKEPEAEEPMEPEAEEPKEPEGNQPEEPEPVEEHLTRAQKRKQYVQKLEEENKRLKEAQKLPWNQGEAVELTKEQLDKMIDERVAERENAKIFEQTRKEWAKDYEATIKKYPELDPLSKSYNKELDKLLTDFLTDEKGNPKLNLKVSEAYERMKKSLETAKSQGAEKASLKLAEQKEKEAIAPNATGNDSNEITWEDMAKLEKDDPEEYFRRIKEGKMPA